MSKKMLLYLIAGLCAWAPSYAQRNIVQLLKPAKHKIQTHGPKGIDYIYIINLDKRPEKYEASLKELSPYHIKPYRFSAVVGIDLPFKKVSSIFYRYKQGDRQNPVVAFNYETCNFSAVSSMIPGKKYLGNVITKGFVGSLLSHLSVIYDAYTSGYKTVWIMEDDVEVLKDPFLLEKLIKALDRRIPNWEILHTNPDMRNVSLEYAIEASLNRPDFPIIPVQKALRQRKSIDKTFSKAQVRLGTHSYILRRSGMRKILRFYEKYGMFGPYDADLRFIPLKAFRCNEHIVTDKLTNTSDNV